MSSAEAVPPLAHAIGGCLGSASALLLLYPLERARIEMQSNVSLKHKQPRGLQFIDEQKQDNLLDPESNASRGDQISYISAAQEESQQPLGACLRQLMDRGELYKGSKSIVTTLAASSFVFFYMNEFMKGLLLRKDTKRIQSLRLLMASCLAGVINVLLTNPLWVTNLRIVSGITKTDSLWNELRQVARDGGMRELYKGTGTSILLVSNPVIQFFTYEQLKGRLGGSSPVDYFCMGAFAKTLATILTYPLQLAQAVLRLDEQRRDDDGASQYTGTMDCIGKLYKRGGGAELFTGMKTKLLQTVLTASFTFLTYEEIVSAIALAMRSFLTRQPANR